MRVARRRTAEAQQAPVTNKVDLEYLDIADITPYEFNPRDNAKAVNAVAESIKAFGFLVPIVVDKDNVIVAGHTRVEAAKKLGMIEVPAINAGSLSEEQVTAFRLIDNKTAELAVWDFDLLSDEISKLQDSGLTLTDFGWTREELDCLTEVVEDDCLSAEGLVSDSERNRLAGSERRSPTTARFVLGELVFFIGAEEYRAWMTSMREEFDFDEDAMVDDIKLRLGLVA